MNKLLEVLAKIKNALGNDCQVIAITNNHGGVTVRAQWHDGLYYDRTYTKDDLDQSGENESLIYRFIGWAKERRKSHDEHFINPEKEKEDNDLNWDPMA